ncbi:MAG: hypothetical protein U9O66_01790 [Patescibacteria group bacterium]|nr:hypothetical protein [Patescibacteria group bacterium]
MPRYNFPSDSSQKKIIKAFKKIGFITNNSGGKGSHIKVIEPKSEKWIIVQKQVYKEAIRSYIKFVEKFGYDIEKFIKYL